MSFRAVQKQTVSSEYIFKAPVTVFRTLAAVMRIYMSLVLLAVMEVN
jgi:hypothetical protein